MRDAAETTVLVTGATDGLGRRLAQKLAAQGAFVLLHGRSTERLGSHQRGGTRTDGQREAGLLPGRALLALCGARPGGTHPF